MASSKVMASRSPPNRDSPRQPSPSRLNIYSDQSRGFGSMNIDDLLRNIYSDPESFTLDNSSVLGDGNNRNKTVQEVWRDIVSEGGGRGGSGEPAMTLEDFLAKAGSVNEEDVRVPPPVQPPAGAFGMETAAMMSPATGVPADQFAPVVCVNDGMTNGGFGVSFANGMVAASGSATAGGRGRGKRRAAGEELPLDKATQQKQRRMIKNRESAARSRERQQVFFFCKNNN